MCKLKGKNSRIELCFVLQVVLFDILNTCVRLSVINPIVCIQKSEFGSYLGKVVQVQ